MPGPLTLPGLLLRPDHTGGKSPGPRMLAGLAAGAWPGQEIAASGGRVSPPC